MNLFKNKFLAYCIACGLMIAFICGAKLSAQINGNGKRSNGKNGVATEEQTWSTFTSKESGFSVDLPKKPEHVHQTIKVPKSEVTIDYDTYVSEPDDSVVYVVSVWNYPAEIDMSKPEVNLQDGFSGMISALPGSKVVNMQMTDVEGYKALEFLVQYEDIFFQGRLILVYNTLYQVFTVYKKSVEMAQNYDHFINSFQLIQPEKRKIQKKGNGLNSVSPKNAKKINF
jgi:hypothetical protein